MHTYIHAYIHTYIRTYIHTYIHTFTYIYINLVHIYYIYYTICYIWHKLRARIGRAHLFSWSTNSWDNLPRFNLACTRRLSLTKIVQNAGWFVFIWNFECPIAICSWSKRELYPRMAWRVFVALFVHPFFWHCFLFAPKPRNCSC